MFSLVGWHGHVGVRGVRVSGSSGDRHVSSRGMARQLWSVEIAASWPAVAFVILFIFEQYRVRKSCVSCGTKTCVFSLLLRAFSEFTTHRFPLRQRAPESERLHTRMNILLSMQVARLQQFVCSHPMPRTRTTLMSDD